MALSVPGSASVPPDFEIGGHILFASQSRLHKQSCFLSSSPTPSTTAVVMEAPRIFFCCVQERVVQGARDTQFSLGRTTRFLENPQAHFLKKYRKPRASPTAGRDSSLCPAFPAVCLLFFLLSVSLCFFQCVFCLFSSSSFCTSLGCLSLDFSLSFLIASLFLSLSYIYYQQQYYYIRNKTQWAMLLQENNQ